NQLAELTREPSRRVLEREVLPTYLSKRRWFAGKNAAIDQVRIAYAVPLPAARHQILLGELDVASEGGHERYLLPLAFIGEDEPGNATPQQLALARLRRGREVGLLTDGFSLDSFVLAVLDGLRANLTLPSDDGELRFVAHPDLAGF